MKELEALTTLAVKARARADVMEVVVAALIAHHPNPQLVLRMFEMTTPDLVDHVEDNAPTLPTYRQEHREQLAHWTSVMRDCAQLHESGQ